MPVLYGLLVQGTLHYIQQESTETFETNKTEPVKSKTNGQPICFCFGLSILSRISENITVVESVGDKTAFMCFPIYGWTPEKIKANLWWFSFLYVYPCIYCEIQVRIKKQSKVNTCSRIHAECHGFSVSLFFTTFAPDNLFKDSSVKVWPKRTFIQQTKLSNSTFGISFTKPLVI